MNNRRSVESFECAGLTINIFYDDDPLNPRKDYTPFGHMVCFHRRYNLGDKHEFSSPEDFEEWAKSQGDNVLSLPLYLYDHSGITMSTGSFHDPWDSGQVGWIYTTKEEVRKEYARKYVSKKLAKRVYELLEGEVKSYDDYLTGNCYGFVIEDSEGEEVYSCWGFLGDIEYCREEAKSFARAALKDRFPLLIDQMEPETC